MVKGKDAYKYFKLEVGVHRVQRVPTTETGGRVHTSTMGVVVFADVEDSNDKVDINPKYLRIETYRSSGAGGQHVNKTDSAVRITHIPTGIVVAIQGERSQHRNKAHAMSILKAKLYDMEKQKIIDKQNMERKFQVGKRDRNERIRTYNYAQDRITDHRIGMSFFGITQMFDGLFLTDLHENLMKQDMLNKVKNLELKEQ